MPGLTGFSFGIKTTAENATKSSGYKGRHRQNIKVVFLKIDVAQDAILFACAKLITVPNISRIVAKYLAALHHCGDHGGWQYL